MSDRQMTSPDKRFFLWISLCLSPFPYLGVRTTIRFAQVNQAGQWFWLYTKSISEKFSLAVIACSVRALDGTTTNGVFACLALPFCFDRIGVGCRLGSSAFGTPHSQVERRNVLFYTKIFNNDLTIVVQSFSN